MTDSSQEHLGDPSVLSRNEDPIYFISATNFNLLGLDEWVREL